VEASGTYVGEKRHCIRARKVGCGMVEIRLLCVRWLSSFLKLVQKVSPGFALPLAAERHIYVAQ